MRSTPSLPLLLGSLWPVMVASEVLSTGQMELNCVLMQNLIVWNGKVFDMQTVLRLNWIVWIRIVWLNWIAWNRNIFDKLCTHAKLNCLK